jgi:hypothetical protein
MTSDQVEEALEMICRVLCDVQDIDPDEAASGFPNWHFQMSEARRILQGLQAVGGTSLPQSQGSALTMH